VKRGLFIGRFQPPHNGHFMAIKYILTEVDELIVVVGSAQFNYILKDPFTAGERILMIREGARDFGIDLSRLIIIPLNNVENNAYWVAYLKSYVPPFHVVYTRNRFVAKLFSDYGIEVREQPLYDRHIYSSTRVRELMLEGGDWASLVPPSVAKIIQEVGGVERLRIAALGEAEPHRY